MSELDDVWDEITKAAQSAGDITRYEATAAIVARARDVNNRLVTAYFLHHHITISEWPNMEDITAAEARACGAIVTAAEAVEHTTGSRTITAVIDPRQAPLYLAHAILESVRNTRAAAHAASGDEADGLISHG